MIGAGAIIGWRHVGGPALVERVRFWDPQEGSSHLVVGLVQVGQVGVGDPKATSAPSGSNDHGPWQASSCQLGLGHQNMDYICHHVPFWHIYYTSDMICKINDLTISHLQLLFHIYVSLAPGSSRFNCSSRVNFNSGTYSARSLVPTHQKFT